MPSQSSTPRFLNLRRAATALTLTMVLASAQELTAQPLPLGRLVDAQGHRVHLYCSGQGSPTVVVAGGFSFDWSLVQPEIAKLTRICTYDVAGTAWSDPGPTATCPDRAGEIHAMLHSAGIEAPIVLAGFSIGGLVSRYYAIQYRDEVAGMVIIDHAFTPTRTSLSPKRDTTWNKAIQVGDSPPVLVEMTPIIVTAEDASDFGKLPENIRQLHRWAMGRRPGLNNAETADDCESRLEASQDAYPLANMPLVVVSTGNTTPGYKQLQAKLLSLSHNSRQETAYDSFHFVAIDQPEVVIAAIRNVVGQVRLRASAETPPQASVAASSPAFDVASLKVVHPIPPYAVVPGGMRHGEVRLRNVTLAQGVKFAFNVDADSLVVGPDWIKTPDVLFDIDAKAPPDTAGDQLRLMTLNLLTERFGIKLHRETREIPFFDLTVDKGGPRFSAVNRDASGARAEVLAGHLALYKVSVALFIRYLSAFTNRPIRDRTSLKEEYDLKVEWTPMSERNGDGLTLQDAIREQLGLRMDMHKGPMDVIVVEHAEKVPVSNQD
jgi:uncharacterized protein (TIGR03435 family)